MIRYAKQKNSSDCGPIAILNALKWAGVRCTYQSDLKKITEKSRCDSVGTSYGYFEKALRHFAHGNFTVTRKAWPGIAVFQKFLRNPDHAAISFFVDTDERKKRKKKSPHAMLIVGTRKTGGRFLCVNFPEYSRGKTAEWVSRGKIIAGHRPIRHLGYSYPSLWFLEKEIRK